MSGAAMLIRREAFQQVGGAVASAQLTLPGFIHDACSAIYPLTIGSPFLSKLPLEKQNRARIVGRGVRILAGEDTGHGLLLEIDSQKSRSSAPASPLKSVGPTPMIVTG